MNLYCSNSVCNWAFGVSLVVVALIIINVSVIRRGQISSFVSCHLPLVYDLFRLDSDSTGICALSASVDFLLGILKWIFVGSLNIMHTWIHFKPFFYYSDQCEVKDWVFPTLRVCVCFVYKVDAQSSNLIMFTFDVCVCLFKQSMWIKLHIYPTKETSSVEVKRTESNCVI